jgi:hypothetical protein
MEAIMKNRLVLGCAVMMCLTCAVGKATPFADEEVRLLDSAASSGVSPIIDDLNSISDEVDDIARSAFAEGSDSKDGVGQSGEITVERGDTLSALAARLLGDFRRWRDLVEWNRDRYPSLLKNPDLILVGWQLRLSSKPVPKQDKTSENDLTGNSVAPAPAGNATVSVKNPSDNSGSQADSAKKQGEGQGPLITADSRVLHIGDSHTCGVYGKSMDALMRETGASVRTYGVSGSSPAWWLKGTTGKSGYFSKDENGRIDQPADWRTPRATPDLQKLIKEFRPSVVMFSLGANLVGASAESVRAQVESVCRIAQQAGCKIVWVAPPKGRSDTNNPQLRQKLYENLRLAAEKYGTFIDSRDFTEYPQSGGDGVHYWGNEGTRIAGAWAGKVFQAVQSPASAK